MPQHLDSFPAPSYTRKAMDNHATYKNATDNSATNNYATLNLASLLGNAAGEYEVQGEGELTPSEALLEADGLRLAGPIAWDLTVSSTGGDDDFILNGAAEGVAIMECRRCLDDVPVELITNFIYPMIYRPGKDGLILVETDDDQEDTLIFGKPEVDFADLISQVFAIDLPLTALCKEDCRGLSSDGVNLNDHPDHLDPAVEADDAPSPFAVLKDFEV